MKRDYRVTIIFIWLLVLTFIMMYDIIKNEGGNNPKNITMPPVIILEEDGGIYDPTI